MKIEFVTLDEDRGILGWRDIDSDVKEFTAFNQATIAIGIQGFPAMEATSIYPSPKVSEFDGDPTAPHTAVDDEF